MRPDEPSVTARAAARHRAVHQLLENGAIFADPLAAALVGEAEVRAYAAEDNAWRRAMRRYVAARARHAEDKLKVAVGRGIRQAVVLGAGLDTFAYRNPFDGLRVIETDHPDTQGWKRRRLTEAGIAEPASVIYAPFDFETQPVEALIEASLPFPGEPAFFSWLGVIHYLTEDAALATLRAIGGTPGGAEIVFDYGEPAEVLDPRLKAAKDARARRVASFGEPLLTTFTEPRMAEALTDAGFAAIEDIGPRRIAELYVPDRVMSAPEHGERFVWAKSHAG